MLCCVKKLWEQRSGNDSLMANCFSILCVVPSPQTSPLKEKLRGSWIIKLWSNSYSRRLWSRMERPLEDRGVQLWERSSRWDNSWEYQIPRNSFWIINTTHPWPTVIILHRTDLWLSLWGTKLKSPHCQNNCWSNVYKHFVCGQCLTSLPFPLGIF